MKRTKCKHCHRLLVEPGGPEDSPILLAGEFPGYYEIASGVPFVGPAGDILKQELVNLSIDWRELRITNLWGHEKIKDEKEFNWHLGRLAEEMEGRKAIMLMGSDIVQALVPGENVMDVAGLKVKSPFAPDSAELVMAMPNPAIAMHGGIGEIRLALTKFFNQARRLL